MDSDIRSKLSELQQRRGRQKQLSEQLSDSKLKTREYYRDSRIAEQAQVLIQKVAYATQQQLQYRVSELVTMALSAVFPNPYEFEIQFIIRRNKTECDLWFKRGENRMHPLSSSGVGAVDIACFALRVALWSLQQPRSRPTLILDEPFKHLSTDLQPRAIEMLQMLSKEIGIQVIMVSHVEDLIEGADRIFRTKLRNGVTTVMAS
jgi:DNA repair exonuclease SbcCD ATPase subunit